MFCNQCGNEIAPGAAFCNRCGSPVAAFSTDSAAAQAFSADPAQAFGAAAQGFTVTFEREKQWYAVNPAIKIIVDDRDEYRIDNGKTIRVPMAPGTHSVVFKCGIRNKVIELTVQQDLTLHLRWNRITGSLVVK